MRNSLQGICRIDGVNRKWGATVRLLVAPKCLSRWRRTQPCIEERRLCRACPAKPPAPRDRGLLEDIGREPRSKTPALEGLRAFCATRGLGINDHRKGPPSSPVQLGSAVWTCVTCATGPVADGTLGPQMIGRATRGIPKRSILTIPSGCAASRKAYADPWDRKRNP
jgi:hypothetical protein